MPSFASYDGTRLWYDILGAGLPLICLPGGPGADIRTFGDLGGLAAHRTLIRLDSRAAGRSAVPADPSSCAFTAQAGDVQALREHLGLGLPDLLAHSAGTLTAQEYAARFGVRALVLVTPAGRAAREPDEAESAAIRARGIATLSPEEDFTIPPPWLRETFYSAGSQSPDRLARLAAVQAPVLALSGAADGIAGTGTARLVGGCYPNATVTIMPGCGHFPWLDEPDGFRSHVLGFLTSLELPAMH